LEVGTDEVEAETVEMESAHPVCSVKRIMIMTEGTLLEPVKMVARDTTLIKGMRRMGQVVKS
jgi:hypothetical protein